MMHGHPDGRERHLEEAVGAVPIGPQGHAEPEGSGAGRGGQADATDGGVAGRHTMADESALTSDADQGPMRDHESQDRHAGHSVAMFRDKFWLSLLLTIPVVAWSHDVQVWLGYTAPRFPGSEWLPAVLGTAIFAYGGLVFLRGAAGELADRRPGMMTLISLAITVAFVTSLASTFGLFEVEIWWELSTLITIMLLGHWLEMRSIAQARARSRPSPSCCRTRLSA